MIDLILNSIMILVSRYYTQRKDKLATKIAYFQDNMLPQPPKLYTGMPVKPVTNSRSKDFGDS